MYKQKQQLRDSYILHIYTCYKNILYTHTMLWYMVQLTLNARLYTHELFLRNLSTCMLAYLIKACVYIYIYIHMFVHMHYTWIWTIHMQSSPPAHVYRRTSPRKCKSQGGSTSFHTLLLVLLHLVCTWRQVN